MSTDILQKKWAPILEHADLPKITDSHKRATIAQMLENQEQAIRESQSGGYSEQTSLLESPTNAMGTSADTAGGDAGNINFVDPVMISLIRRAMPNLIAYDIAGVQPMTGPTGLIFAMSARYTNQTGDESFYDESDTNFSGQNAAQDAPGGVVATSTAADPFAAAGYTSAGGMTTAQSEALGNATGNQFAEMAFSIEKVSVVAKSRALKAEYTMELAQDLKAVHGLDAESELASILSTEILAEINREVVRTVNVGAVLGAADTATPGTFDLDVDANGRWSVEKFKGLMFQLEREANQIAKDTRRGKGNILICSSDVASALQMAGVLDYTPALSNSLQVDDTGSTFAGVLNGRVKVYIDPYFQGTAGSHYATMGYKGSSTYDSGVFYCPYVPLQMVRAVGQDSFQPKIGFKTRYGMVANPFARSVQGAADVSDGTITSGTNAYYRKFKIVNLM